MERLELHRHRQGLLTSADIQKAIDAGAIKAAETDDGAKTMTLNVLVEADAIQAEGFADAAAAWAAFK